MDASSEMPQLRHSPSPSNPSFVDMINILVVDDDATTLAIVSAMLKTWSYQVVSVKNPVDALATLRAQKGVFDLVVTDLHMPQMNGFELHRHIHEEFKLPVIMMSADDKESVILKSLEGGVAYYIVKPVSKDDIKNVWQYAVAAKKGKSVIALEEVESDPREAPGRDIEDGGNSETSSNVDQNKRDSKKAESKKKGRKRSRDDNDEEEELLAAPKKAKVVWTNTLHNHFLMAIRHIGLDKAVPKKILEFMKVPGLTRENVASHLQKYRLFLKRVAEKARLSKCLSERVFRSSFAFGHPGLMTYNNVEGDQYSQLFMNQQQPTGGCGIGNALALTSAPSKNLGSIQFPPQLGSSGNNIAFPQLVASGQSRLLNNNIQANNILRQQAMFGNGSLVNQATRPAVPFRMQQVMNNFGNGGMSYGLMNNIANNIGPTSNIGTNNLMQMFAQGQARQGFTNNPFTFNTIYNPIENMAAGSFNNVNNQLISNMADGTNMMNSVFNNNNGGSGFPNGYFNNETMNGLMTGIRTVNLSGARIGNNNSGYVSRRLGASSSLSSMSVSSASLGYETSTTTSSSGYQLASPGSNKNVSVLPKPAEGITDNSYGGRMMNNHNKDNIVPPPLALINNNNISYEQGHLADIDDNLMLSNLFMEPQNNYQPPPPAAAAAAQQNGGDEDEVTPNFSSFFDQFEVAGQPTGNNYQQGVMNQAEDQVPDPAVNQVIPNPNSSGSSNVEENAPTEQSESQEQAGDQLLKSEFSSNIFASEDYNILFDPDFPFQDYDDDFMAALLGSGI